MMYAIFAWSILIAVGVLALSLAALPVALILSIWTYTDTAEKTAMTAFVLAITATIYLCIAYAIDHS